MAKDSKHWVALFLSSILAAFAVGVLWTRGAYAQVIVPTPPYPFPRVSDLWSLQLDNANYVTADVTSGYQISGYRFTVTPDHGGRIPVVTAFLARASTTSGSSFPEIQDGQFELWRLGTDGYYKRIFTQSSSHRILNSQGYDTYSSSTPDPDRSLGVGLPLPAGSYLFRLPRDQNAPDWSNDTALLGYLGRP